MFDRFSLHALVYVLVHMQNSENMSAHGFIHMQKIYEKYVGSAWINENKV